MHPPSSPPVIDGVPHTVIAYLVGTIVGIAMAMFLGYTASGVALACAFGFVAGIYAIIRLSRRAQRERVEEHVVTTDDPADAEERHRLHAAG